MLSTWNITGIITSITTQRCVYMELLQVYLQVDPYPDTVCLELLQVLLQVSLHTDAVYI